MFDLFFLPFLLDPPFAEPLDAPDREEEEPFSRDVSPAEEASLAAKASRDSRVNAMEMNRVEDDVDGVDGSQEGLLETE